MNAPASAPATVRAPAARQPATDWRRIEGKWKVVFIGSQQADLSGYVEGTPLAIDTSPMLVIKDGILTVRSTSLTETNRIERLDLPDGGTGEIDLEEVESRNQFLGLVRLDGDRLILRLHLSDRPVDFTIRPDQNGSLIVAERAKN